MFAGVVTTLLLIGLMAIIFNYSKKKESPNNEDFNRNDVFGELGFEVFLGCILLLWLIPWGVFIIIPVALLLSLVSPAGRDAWRKFAKIRIYAAASLCILLLIGGFVPASEPISPSNWGEPLLKENPNAPLYPAGNQYTWVMLPSDGGLNIDIVQSLTIRVPYQFSKFSSASTS